MVEVYTPSDKGGELSIWEDKSQAFEDLPDNLVFLDHGTRHAENPRLDERIEEQIVLGKGLAINRKRRSMDAADFRERCVVYNNRLYALYEKRAIDFKPAWYLRSEKLAGVLDIPIDLAHRLVELIKALELDRKNAHRLIYGYTMANGQARGGLISLKSDPDEIAETIEYLEDLLSDDQDALVEYEPAPGAIDDFWDERLIYYQEDPDQIDQDWDSLDEIPWDDGLDRIDQDNNPFGAFPLSDGRDGVNYLFIDYIKTADVARLKSIQAMFFPRSNAYTGRVYKAELAHLTGDQRSILWGFINDRKAKLAQIGLKSLDRDGKKVLRLVRDMGKGAQTRGLIMAWSNNRPFDLGGVDLEFSNRPDEMAIFAMWAAYREL
jgi:hypothetical protein